MTAPRLPDAAWRHRAGLGAVVAALGPGQARFVGGAVRDTLAGLTVNDIDIATPLVPDTVVAALAAVGLRSVPTGIAHGTVTALAHGETVEITTLRRDVATDGRRATVAFADDWREDAARRDFTINALYADPATSAIDDWFGGIADLAAGRIAFIGEPLTRIAEDHLRILRFFRFHARFARGAPDAAGYEACAARANDLMALSRERIADELTRLLALSDPVPAVGLMLARDILKPVLPEIADDRALVRLIEREASAGIPAEPLRRLAALLGPGPDRAQAVAARLRLSKAHAKRLVAACTLTDERPRALAYRRGAQGAVDALLLGQGDLAAVHDAATFDRPSLPLSGGALIARGLAPGPAVARTLAAIERAWVAASFPTGDRFEAIVTAALGSEASS